MVDRVWLSFAGLSREVGVVARRRSFDVEHLLLTPAEVAQPFKVNPLTVTRWAVQGRIA